MNIKKVPETITIPSTQSHCKDSHSYLIIATVRELFLNGNKLTARRINEITGSNDARKVISILRADGWNIRDVRLPNNCKLYWLSTNVNQLNLFENEGE